MDRQLRLTSPICRLLPPNSRTSPTKARKRRSRRMTRGTTRSVTHLSGLYSMEKSWLKTIVPAATMKTRSPLDARLQYDKDYLFDCAGTVVFVVFRPRVSPFCFYILLDHFFLRAILLVRIWHLAGGMVRVDSTSGEDLLSNSCGSSIYSRRSRYDSQVVS